MAALFWGLFFFGLIDLAVVLLDPAFYRYYLLETGWGLLYTVLVAVPLVFFVFRPTLLVVVWQLVAVSLAVAAVGVATAYLPQVIPAAALFATAIVAAALAQLALWPRRDARWNWRPFDATVTTAVVVAAGASLFYSQTLAADIAGPFQDDVSWGFLHLPMQIALAWAIPMAAAVSVLASVRNEPGALLPAWTSAIAAAWLGAVSAAYPHHAGSLGLPTGIAAAAWAGLFVAASHMRRRLAGQQHVSATASTSSEHHRARDAEGR